MRVTDGVLEVFFFVNGASIWVLQYVFDYGWDSSLLGRFRLQFWVVFILGRNVIGAYTSRGRCGQHYGNMKCTSFQLGLLYVFHMTLICTLGRFLTILGVFEVTVSLVRRAMLFTILFYYPVQRLFGGTRRVFEIFQHFFRGVVLRLYRTVYNKFRCGLVGVFRVGVGVTHYTTTDLYGYLSSHTNWTIFNVTLGTFFRGFLFFFGILLLYSRGLWILLVAGHLFVCDVTCVGGRVGGGLRVGRDLLHFSFIYLFCARGILL